MLCLKIVSERCSKPVVLKLTLIASRHIFFFFCLFANFKVYIIDILFQDYSNVLKISNGVDISLLPPSRTTHEMHIRRVNDQVFI